MENRLSRRAFLKLAALGLSGLALPGSPGGSRGMALAWQALDDFPPHPRLARVAAGKVELKARPDSDSQTTGVLFEDAVLPWLREVAGRHPYRTNQRWVETPDGYLWSPYLQPVENLPNQPLDSLPESSLGIGMWVEVTRPYVNLILHNPPPRSPGFKDRLEVGLPLRLYYGQVVWVDSLRIDDQGQAWYRVNELYGSYGDILWGKAQAFRPITAQEIAPLSPEVEDKRVVIDLTYQTMSCYEGPEEVFFARISSGAKWDAYGNPVDVWATPVGKFPIWRKLLSLHMSGGTTGGGWDLPGVGWVSLFVGSGVAIHSTFWHSNYSEPMSRGCINARPEDAKWVFRETLPKVPLDPGDQTVAWPGGTVVEVVEH